MTLDCNKCLICGRNATANKRREVISENNESAFFSWKNECAGTLCDILFGSESHSLMSCFKNTEFCNSCRQIVRDVNFTYRRIQSFQSTLDQLTESIRKRLSMNYLRLKKKGECDVDQKNVAAAVADRCQVDASFNFDDYNYTHQELIEIIYTAASNYMGQIPMPIGKLQDNMILDENKTNIIDGEPTVIKVELIKSENVDASWDSGDTSDGFDPDWQQDVEVRQENRGRKRKEKRVRGSDNTAIFDGYQPKREGSLYNRAMKRKKLTSNWSTKMAKIKAKKNMAFGENKKRGRPRKHPIMAQPKGTISCTFENCDLMFTTEEKMTTHVRGFHEGVEKPYQCSHIHCSIAFAKWKELVSHKREVHDKRKKKSHSCKFCGKPFDFEEELNAHYSGAHQGLNPFTCAFCPEVFSNSVDLRMHVKKVHPDPEDLMKPLCLICNKYFSNQNNYNMHMKWQHGSPELVPTCSQCNRQFSSRGALKKHTVRYHSKEVKYTCDTCGRGFTYIGDLTDHAKLHDESNKKYACKICNKKFASSETCKMHEITHTDIKEYVCEICAKAFAKKGNLTVHVKLHSREGNAPLRIRERKPKNAIVNTNNIIPFSQFGIPEYSEQFS